MRMCHEKRSWRKNCFVTLTYDNAHLPPGGTLVPEHLRNFMKRLRKARGAGVRFYACGEYGELNCRPHYHAILFNCDFPDQLFHSRNGRDEPLYTSAELLGLWDNGNHLIGDVTFESCAYVARYVVKKITGKRADDHYAVIDGDGVVYDRTPEFARMSRRPGLGTRYYERFGQEVRDHDTIVVDGREVSPPRFYDKATEQLSSKMWNDIRRKRKRRAAANAADNTADRLRVKEKLAIAQLERKERRI